MFPYIIVVVAIVILSSALLIYVLKRAALLNLRMILAIALSSVLISVLFPGIFNAFSDARGGIADGATFFLIFLTTLVLYIILTFLMGIIVSMVIPDNTFDLLAAGIKSVRMHKIASEQAGEVAVAASDAGEPVEGGNYLEQIYGSLVVENGSEPANYEDIAVNVENNFEKSVDTDENIDKMGLDALEADHLTINDCVDEAFRLKDQGDLEGAILYYMYALDKAPDKDLVFWIVLDICVLYKALHQVELAQDILAGYMENYSDLMDPGVKEEIERNLLTA